MTIDPGLFAATGLTLYAMHHAMDYWGQTDYQARHKGDAGRAGITACLAHVASYTLGQGAGLGVLALLGMPLSARGVLAGLLVSAVTHYLADRREHGIMFRLARLIPGKANFLKLGVPRPARIYQLHGTALLKGVPDDIVITDNPSLGTGAWALDQAWHIFWGVWVAGLLVVAL